jgi:hypothetical protein
VRGIISVVAVGMLSCAGAAPLVESTSPDLSVIEDAPPPYEPPTLTASVPVDDPPAFAVGSASLDLSAHPEKHEIRVSLMVGAPVAHERWRGCRDLRLEVDGDPIELSVTYSGVAMQNGSYDAVTAELSIEHVRAMSHATDVRATVCGDVVYPRAERLGSLRDFVHRFEEMATHDGPSLPAPPPEFDPENPDADSEPVVPPLPA